MPGYTGSIPLTGFIAPSDTADTYAVLDPLFGIDGLRNVNSLGNVRYDYSSNSQKEGWNIMQIKSHLIFQVPLLD
mgnify:CR=1 FL=1